MIPLRDAARKPGIPVVTILLIIVMIFAFLTEIQTPDIETFIAKYALIPANVDFGNLATLLPFLTSMFLHAGLIHILSNLWFFWIFGDNVELEIGRLPYLALFLLSGLGGGLLHYFFYPDSVIPTLGASGAIAGVLGSYFVFFPRNQIVTLVPLVAFVTVMRLPAYVMLGYWIVLQILSGVTSLGGDEGGVGWFAHIGGFVVGVVAALLYRSLRRVEAY